jgi:cytoskeleton protein RodZ
VSKSFEETDAHAEGFGERLRREREMRGISLDEIAATTKIGTRLLRALESEQFDLLPGGIFNKSYVRAYARHVGLDEEQAVADYLKAARETPPDVRLIAHQNFSMHGDPGRYGSNSRRGFPLIPAVILLVVIVGAAGGWRLYQQRQRERQSPTRMQDVNAGQPSSAGPNSGVNAAPEPAGSAAAAPPPETVSVLQVPASSSSAANAPVRTVQAAESPSSTASGASTSTAVNGGTPFEVTVRTKDRARVEVRSDDEIVVRGVIEPYDVKTFHATKRLVFWTANAGEVELSFNGKNVPLKGGENDEQVLVFNSHGLLVRPAAQ